MAASVCAACCIARKADPPSRLKLVACFPPCPSQAAEILQQGRKVFLRERRVQLMTISHQDVYQTRRAAVVEQASTLVEAVKRRRIEEPPIALVGETHVKCRTRSEFRRGVAVHAIA